MRGTKKKSRIEKWVREKLIELRSRFYRRLFVIAFPNVVVVPFSFGDYHDTGTYLYSKPVNCLVKDDIEAMSSEVYKLRFHDKAFRVRVNELYDCQYKCQCRVGGSVK